MKKLDKGLQIGISALFLLVMYCCTVYSQAKTREESFDIAIHEFKSGHYKLALTEFELIYPEYPDKSKISHYMGASMVHMDVRAKESIKLLEYSAANNYTTTTHLYLFRAYLKDYQFEKAEISLANFKNLSNRREKEKNQIRFWEQQLEEVREAYNEKKPQQTEEQANEVKVKEEVTITSVVEKEPEKAIFQLDYDLLIQRAMLAQLGCDSLKSELVILKNHLRSESDDEVRKTIFSDVKKTQKQIDILQHEADSLFTAAKVMNSESVMSKVHFIKEEQDFENEHIRVDKKIRDIKVYAFKNRPKKQGVETIVSEEESQGKFQILEMSPYSNGNPIPMDRELPSALIYRIQLGAYSQDLPQDAFRGLTPLYAETVEGKGITKYFVGIFFSSKEAKWALEKVRAYGYADAFLVPYFNKEKIPVQRAREIEFGEKK